MNELHNSIHSRYYKIITMLLELLQVRDISLEDVKVAISSLGFDETEPYLLPRLIDCNCKDNYKLFINESNKIHSRLKDPTYVKLSNIEYQWLKTASKDSRFRLFFRDDTYYKILHLLDEKEDLINDFIFENLDEYGNVDNFTDNTYITNFNTILYAIRDKKVLNISYINRRNKTTIGTYLPISLIYSMKENKFSLRAYRTSAKSNKKCILSLNGIKSIEVMDIDVPQVGNISFITHKRKHVDIIISNNRNGFDRVFYQLATYERETEYDEITGNCHMKLFYNSDYETELLITLISFGPIIKVIGPDKFLSQFRKRLQDQYDLIGNKTV